MQELRHLTSESQISIDDGASIEKKSDKPADPRSTWKLICTFSPFLALVPTTVLSILLWVANEKGWVAWRSLHGLLEDNRATVQLCVQVIASSLGFLDLFVICTLINYRTRLRLSASSMSLVTLRFWDAMLAQQLDKGLPIRLFIPVGMFICACMAPAALWAGTITPVNVVTQNATSFQIPSYHNITTLNLNNSDRIGLGNFSNHKGLFTYNPGERLVGPLLVAASTASTTAPAGRAKYNAKLDYTGFNFVGRSYGVGSASGLSDDAITQDPLAIGYTYQEIGYQTSVECTYNTSSQYHLSAPWGEKGGEINTYIAQGFLPNSVPGQEEWSRYPSYSTDNIVAVGIATIHSPEILKSARRMLGISSGRTYQDLNNTQCEAHFIPTLFNVSVMLDGRNITVVPVSNVSVTDMEPTGLLAYLAIWSIMLMSTDQTSIYTSLIGNSFQQNKENFIAAKDSEKKPLSDSETILRALADSITGVIDGVLGAYAAAQLMVDGATGTTEPVAISIAMNDIQFGQRLYITGITILNLVIIAWVIVEAVLTKGWKELEDLDYTNPSHLILGIARSYEGGEGMQLVRHSHRDFKMSQHGPYFDLMWRGVLRTSAAGRRNNDPSLPT